VRNHLHLHVHRHVRRRRLTAALASFPVALLATIALLVGGADAAVLARPPIPHPTLAGSLVLRVSTTNNYWGGSYDDGHAITVAGNGLVTIVPPRSNIRRSPHTPELVQADEPALQKVLRRARHVGLLGPKRLDTGESYVTDQGTTTIEVHAAGINRTIDVYALPLPDGDHGLTPKQRHARRALRAFIHDLTRPAYYQYGLALD